VIFFVATKARLRIERILHGAMDSAAQFGEEKK
jgi:hypothetical protein